ncbi:MAG: hypothetical protein J5J06_18995 [Phycisphaerae bacterium]|nr:hypothetical protein [Phycisphaerae bacterium]
MSGRKPARKRGWGRWLLRGFLALVVLALLAVCVLAVMGKVAESRWEKLAAEIRASGQPLTLDEVLASRPAIPPEEDGGPIIYAALSELKKVDVPYEGVLMLDDKCEFEFPERLDAKCLEHTREYLKSHAGVLDQLTELLEYPDARLRIEYASDVIGAMSSSSHVFSKLRDLCKILYIDAAVASADGDHDRAARDTTLLLRLAGAIHEEPTLIANLIAMAVESMAARLTTESLQLPETDAPILKRLQVAWERSEKMHGFRMVLLGERAGDLNMMTPTYGFAPSQPGVLTSPPWWTSVVGLRAYFLNCNRMNLAEYYSILIEATDRLPKDLWSTAQSEEKRLQSRNPLNMSAGFAAPVVTRAIELHLRSLAESRCVIAILASERYRLANGAFPAELSDLVPAFLDGVPADPFDDKPLRLKHEDDGALVIYSIGANETDDDGSIDPPQGRGRAPDVGFRLLPPEKRALPTIE